MHAASGISPKDLLTLVSKFKPFLEFTIQSVAGGCWLIWDTTYSLPHEK